MSNFIVSTWSDHYYFKYSQLPPQNEKKIVQSLRISRRAIVKYVKNLYYLRVIEYKIYTNTNGQFVRNFVRRLDMGLKNTVAFLYICILNVSLSCTTTILVSFGVIFEKIMSKHIKYLYEKRKQSDSKFFSWEQELLASWSRSV